MKCQHVHRSSGRSSTLVLARHGRSDIISTTRASCPNALGGAENDEDEDGVTDDTKAEMDITVMLALGVCD